MTQGSPNERPTKTPDPERPAFEKREGRAYLQALGAFEESFARAWEKLARDGKEAKAVNVMVSFEPKEVRDDE